MARVAEPWHFEPAPAPEPVKIFTAPAPTLVFGVHLFEVILHGRYISCSVGRIFSCFKNCVVDPQHCF